MTVFSSRILLAAARYAAFISIRVQGFPVISSTFSHMSSQAWENSSQSRLISSSRLPLAIS